MNIFSSAFLFRNIFVRWRLWWIFIIVSPHHLSVQYRFRIIRSHFSSSKLVFRLYSCKRIDIIPLQLRTNATLIWTSIPARCQDVSRLTCCIQGTSYTKPLKMSSDYMVCVFECHYNIWRTPSAVELSMPCEKFHVLDLCLYTQYRPRKKKTQFANIWWRFLTFFCIAENLIHASTIQHRYLSAKIIFIRSNLEEAFGRRKFIEIGKSSSVVSYFSINATSL